MLVENIMNEYTAIISQLEKKNILFDVGLSEMEIGNIQKKYDFQFPRAYITFAKIGLPISTGFYNWRDFSIKNVEYIKQTMKLPFENICENIQDVYWCDEWGPEPDGTDRSDKILKKIKEAPKLIPIYGHRFMPMLQVDDPPILSICGADIIYYGKNLKDYLACEFLGQKHDPILKNYLRIQFWSEIM